MYLFILALIALVPAFLFSAFLLARNSQAQSELVRMLVAGTSHSIVQSVEREMVAHITTLKVLATAPALIDGDFQSFYTRARGALEDTNTYVFLLDKNLMAFMSTRVPFGEQPRPAAAPEAARRALDTHAVVISDVVFGQFAQQWTFQALLPLAFPGRDEIVMGLSRNASDLVAVLHDSKLPAGWKAALVDGAGKVIVATPGAGVTADPFALGDASWIARSSGWTESVGRDGSDNLAIVEHSALSGWSLVVWAPRDLIARPLSNTFWSLLVGGVLLAAVVVLAIYWVSLQIGRSVHGLENDARLLGAGEAVVPHDYPISEIANVSEMLADASRRRKAAETEVRLLMRELAHRSKNQMTVIAAMAKQSAKGAESVPEFVSGFEKRIFGLARSTDLLLAQGIGGVDLREVFERQIDPLCALDSGRVTLRGPRWRLNSQAAQILGMAAHELATNAVKFGAFATETGRLEVTWEAAGAALHLVWREHVKTSLPDRPDRRGFGTTVLELMVGRSLGATVKRTLHPDGIEWDFVIPLAALDLHAEPSSGTAEPPPAVGREAPGAPARPEK